ncbi:sugar ABC transporter ATP-binding protein [Parasphaerochaeta coccoides]|uniref:Monosaccharide ABC transporter ATP-binding protein, CUT2 family n=1 Tax=Parasphaerochaeta coccoides (strain ATCC BAA-1237 / DSM 17374 / SPN1) TaxID=760011 RepID=F4GHM8_PARC1|nr:sugar ABC transporter ATP-binding protein [Parasphaerochaeta coccoides]AEC01566.1 monosaccharide ABC transporter ATP-binding protein, CUT2 family [Parasphaerochaeta coccoides DSM 17374]
MGEVSTVLSMRHVNKTFPGVKALDDVDFTLRKGEIHALMGENGAGKSTLIKVLTGVHAMDSGEIFVDGINHPVLNHSPQEAQKNGISTVYQEVNLCPNISVAENIFIGRQPLSPVRTIQWKKMNAAAERALSNVGLQSVDVTRALEDYSIAVQQMVAIARAVDIQCKVLVLDEPTSSLDEHEVRKLFEVMRNLRERGVGIIFITHFLEQVYEVCDAITVLRNGRLVGEYPVSQLSRIQLVSKMLGHDFDDLASIRSSVRNSTVSLASPSVIKATGLAHAGTIQPFDIEIHKGEVIGLSGLLGSGRSELARTIYGADRADKGELVVHEEPLSVHDPIDAIKKGMGFLPEDRKEESIIAELSVRENMIIALQAKTGIFRLLPLAKQNELADKYIKALRIKTPSPETPIKQLSGGNQQKAILGRWLITNPQFLILDEPTRGIDVGTKTEIQKLILQLAGEGMAIMFISSEIDEMLRTVNRLCILREGRKVGELENTNLTREEVMTAIAGGYET